MWGFRYLETLAQDLRFGLRMMIKDRGFTAVAVLTLALGIGANTAMFSAVDAVLIRPLPYVDAGSLVMIWDEMSYIGFPKHYSTPAEWREWRQNNTVFTDIAATQPVQAILSGDGEPEEVPARKVTANLWTLLGAQPLLGRVFNEDEDAQGARVAVISYGLWQRRFGASPDALGRKIILNDSPYEVIGVMPREFYFMPARDIDIWAPTSFSAQMLNHFSWHDLHCIARLKPGVSLRQAREEMAALSLRVSAPHVSTPRAAVVTPLREELAGKTQTSLIVLMSASVAVLLIACVNLANLLMSRWAARRHEMAVRAALGARFKFGHLGEKGYSYTIVGVVKEIRERGVAEELKPAIYRVHEQADQTGNQPSGIVVRASVEPEAIVSAVRQAIWPIDKNQPVTRVQTFENIVARQLSAPSQNTSLLGAFALLALLLASLGLYGVLSYAVTQRAHEIGVRMALGATSKDILLSFGRRGLALTLLGLAIGSILAAVTARFMTTLFYGFRPDYLPTVAVVSLILLAVAALACFIPARRAANVDPLVVLRNE